MGPEIIGEGREHSNINLDISSNEKGTQLHNKIGGDKTHPSEAARHYGQALENNP